MRCTHCGSMIGPTDQACPACGTAVVPTAPSAAPPSFDPTAPLAPPAPPRPYGAAWPGSVTPGAAPSPNPWAVPPPGSTWGVPGQSNQPAWQPPAQPYAYGGPGRTRDAGAGYSIAGIICGAIALVFCPIVLGVVGLVLSAKAKKRGESLAGVARVVSIVGLVGGMLLGVLVYTQL